MPELRKDPIVGHWVIIAPERARRPIQVREATRDGSTSFDPFAEDATPPEILAYREPGTRPDTPGWRVRVVPNSFPALQVEGNLRKRGDGIYDMMTGVGAHEVIIECPHAEEHMSRLPVENIREVLWAYRDRLVDLKKDPRLVHGLVFKNSGAAAGASLWHAHSQLIVAPVVPVAIQEEISGALDFYNYRGRCIFEDMLQQELATESRIVLQTPCFVVFCPFASRFPFEMWIVPRQQSSHFEDIQRQAVDELGTVLRGALARLDRALDEPAYNYVIHSAPFSASDLPHYRWHIEILPRLTGVAGYEWGSGSFINPVPPEEAAGFLRDADSALPLPSDTSTSGH